MLVSYYVFTFVKLNLVSMQRHSFVIPLVTSVTLNYFLAIVHVPWYVKHSMTRSPLMPIFEPPRNVSGLWSQPFPDSLVLPFPPITTTSDALRKKSGAWYLPSTCSVSWAELRKWHLSESDFIIYHCRGHFKGMI